MTTREATQYLPLGGAGAWPDDIPRRQRDRIAVAAWALIQWPWLLRSLSGGSPAAKRALLDALDLPADAVPALGSWKADVAFLKTIVTTVERKRPRTVVELGMGASTLIAARALERAGGGQLVSCDQHAGFVDATRRWLAEHGAGADLRATPLKPSPGDWPGVWYDTGPLPDRIDLLIVDGPPWSIHPLVRGAADSLFDRLPVSGTVLLDDGARPGERAVAARWRRDWPNFRFRLDRSGTKGTLVGTRLA